MKNKKGQTIYSEEIFFPCEFRAKQPSALIILPMCCLQDEISIMPCILHGWVQDELHIQFSHQSLN